MLLLGWFPIIYSEEEYNELKIKNLKLMNELQNIHSELNQIQYTLTTQKIFHEPDIILSVMKSEKYGDKWLGRVRIPDEMKIYIKNNKSNRIYLSFIVCNASEFSDKNDPKLIEMAKKEAVRVAMNRFSHLSLKFKNSDF